MRLGGGVGTGMWTEMLKAVPNLVVALITLSLGWLVGLRLTARWDERKKRRELDLLALGAFYEAYGQFCAIWKSWDGAPDSLRQDDPFQTEMLRRAVEAEGKVESLLVRLASERSLSQQECTVSSWVVHTISGIKRGAVPLAQERNRPHLGQGWGRAVRRGVRESPRWPPCAGVEPGRGWRMVAGLPAGTGPARLAYDPVYANTLNKRHADDY
ncbi:hypothetical protein ABZ897_06130 [Nonomuraea sp. NPDC046802]|uniref:mechanosensitive ion channel family protein n=1 Tax=Nonomuraea sp. NPDC046802 TaxID=3154919 RepID=UPI0033E442FE